VRGMAGRWANMPAEYLFVVLESGGWVIAQ